ncbi:hypothetical protein BDA96_10G352300 [Sorghum bicolor]|jgi:hypothetical protein|uniref:C2H2-type domain-containing protein n=2 Tax=Sorghum bicolor TaxID=4558 RepID=A0A921U382_SORBI|nr:zinc finger protein ZAT3 [Sorghum bicolor]KAG0516324.1 hypothetical protein BDA96_10G352300 [Sorghum bicolor]|eukprot:XP_002439063.2 zinc finger protein ZAT3 [Sorghum bicolor]
MNEAQVFFMGMVYGQYLAGGVGAPPGGGGGEDPKRPWRPMSSHEADAVPAAAQQRKKKAASRNRSKNESGDGPHPCPVCDRRFDCRKAVHGHQRSHPERAWRGMAPPAELPVVAVTADGRQLRYACERCGGQFETRQALGGHRASHSGRLGCYWLSKQHQDRPAQQVVMPFDLNEPAVPPSPEQQPEDQEGNEKEKEE